MTVRCSKKCMRRYHTKGKAFKGPKRFRSCVEAFEQCCSGVTNPEGLCGKIRRGKAAT